MINYHSIISNLHYSPEISNVEGLFSDIINAKTYQESTYFLSQFKGYNPEIEKDYKAGELYVDRGKLLSGLGQEIKMLEEKFDMALNRCYQTWYAPGANSFLSPFSWQLRHNSGDDYESEYLEQIVHIATRIVEEKDSSKLYEHLNKIPKKEDIRAAEKMSEKENYYCLQNAIYEVYEKQMEKTDKPTSTYPITLNMYPRKMQAMVELLVEKTHGKNNMKRTSGKDYDFLSFVDDIGRGEAMMFYDVSDILIPIAHTTYSYEGCMNIMSRSQIDESITRDTERQIISREYDYDTLQFTDSTYSIRVIMAAIESIQKNRIDSRNENIPQEEHRLSEIIKKYPILTEVARDKNLFFSKIDELVVISKIIQAEYDARNYSYLAQKNFKRAARIENYFSYDFRNAKNIHSMNDYSVDFFLNNSLTEDEKKIMESLLAQQPLQENPIPVVSFIEEKAKKIKQECFDTFCNVCQKKIDTKTKENLNFLEVINQLNEDKSIQGISRLMILSPNHNFLENVDEKYQEHVSFLRTVLKSNDLNPLEVANALIEGIEITKENSNAIRMMQNHAVVEMLNYSQANKKGDYYPYSDIVQKLLIMRMVASNEQLMKNSNKANIDIELPLLYRDLTHMVELCQQQLQENLTVDGSFGNYLERISKKITEHGESRYFSNRLRDNSQNKELNAFLDFTLNISSNGNNIVEKIEERQHKIDYYLQDIIIDEQKRKEIGEVWGFYGPELLEEQSPRLMAVFVANFVRATSKLDMKTTKHEETGIKK